jgi:8-oxo-dGTP diphosphatase
MIKAFLNMLLGILLFFIATIPVRFLTLIGFLFTIILYLFTLNLKSAFNKIGAFFHQTALSTDQHGNVTLQEITNLTMIKKGVFHHKFGDEDDTLSYCVAVNFKRKTLNLHGLFWAYLLIFVDFRARAQGTNHLDKAIQAKVDKTLSDLEEINFNYGTN